MYTMHLPLTAASNDLKISHDILADEVILKSYVIKVDTVPLPNPVVYVDIPWMNGKQHMTNEENQQMLVLPIETNVSFQSYFTDYRIPLPEVTSIPRSFRVNVYTDKNKTAPTSAFRLDLFFEFSKNNLNF